MRITTTKRSRDTYFELVHSFPLRRLRSSAEHATAKQIYLRLSGSTDRGTKDYVDVLIDLIADYERRAGLALDNSKVAVGDLVRHRLQERKMSVSTLAKKIEIPQSNLSQMLSGRRDWSKSAIRALSSLLNIRAERFLS